MLTDISRTTNVSRLTGDVPEKLLAQLIDAEWQDSYKQDNAFTSATHQAAHRALWLIVAIWVASVATLVVIFAIALTVPSRGVILDPWGAHETTLPHRDMAIITSTGIAAVSLIAISSLMWVRRSIIDPLEVDNKSQPSSVIQALQDLESRYRHR